ncbi:MAG: 2-oxoacid:acceptor oxidoreductase subunit alpha [Gammaproteobacteria bacterium]|nr:2-oxoacid:acceptor oxidoreductase subunit alpha [Gammaproteobacteria bacterium]NNF49291.1 2-oxoacid:acceptor oxidoreductase subunit alpha [Woeseiaceae bacterium]MBT8094815.1 2-oxoacid:acceptor oxidoreductase subunit alpha [Gammaproteobacteria bacterium]MBT8105009.1 2-oxoacid:acceptor oxidoreductase subunit alpha [Gammaproteobacteria bacterium]NNK25023.1 2-oxoacid:acceptor oxidoreductase subunit alpha [Woeseiaceae bacterium]
MGSTPSAAAKREHHEAGHQIVKEHTVEIVSDSGEGAQKCGQIFGLVCGKMGNGVWTVEIIPAEIQPPARERQGASGIRVRMGSHYVTNMGDQADLVVAFNEQVLYSRIANGAYRKGTVVLLENMWAEDPDEKIRQQYAEALQDFYAQGLIVHELPIQKECLKLVENPRRGKNMFVLGMLCHIYQRDVDKAKEEIAKTFRKKSAKVVEINHKLFDAGYAFARDNLDYEYEIPSADDERLASAIVVNGNQAAGLGVMAAGIDLVAMYPITPATSASHYLADDFNLTGGFVHQAEDEIAAIGFAIGASYAGKTACTITSGPGMALKTEMIGLAVMAELPLVIIDVQRGGPSTGLPTKIEQGDLLSTLFGVPGDSPKVVIAAATIAECLEFVSVARRIAESFRTPVIVLTDANLATGVQPIARPDVTEDWFPPPLDQSDWDEDVPPYDWDEETGLSERPIPGMRNGEYILTGLAHNRQSKIAYDSASNQEGAIMRSRKLATLAATLKPPEVHGDETGDLLIVSWGSTHGAIEEAVDRARDAGKSVASVHLRFLSPLEPGLEEIFRGFRKVMTIELNYSDDPEHPLINKETRRYAQLAQVLRSHTLMDIDCWSVVPGHPLSPGRICQVIDTHLGKLEGVH